MLVPERMGWPVRKYGQHLTPRRTDKTLPSAIRLPPPVNTRLSRGGTAHPQIEQEPLKATPPLGCIAPHKGDIIAAHRTAQDTAQSASHLQLDMAWQLLFSAAGDKRRTPLVLLVTLN